MTSGVLSVVNVYDHDSLIYASGEPATPVWLYERTPVLDAEVGGREWSDAKSYLEGDIVIEVGVMYIALEDNAVRPSTHVGVEWKLVMASEIAGKLYDPAVTYANGDIVSENDFLYIADAPIVGSAPSNGVTGEWTRFDITEIGGKEFDSGYMYVVGDVVSYLKNVYTCILNMTLLDGSQVPLNETHWSSVGITEIGGRLFKGLVLYKAGDVVGSVTAGNQYVYLCIQNMTLTTGQGLDNEAYWIVSGDKDPGIYT